MNFYMHHGRTDPDGLPQVLGEDGTPRDVDDWGFEGPRLSGVIGFHSTYGSQGHWNLWFDEPTSADIAHALTGWEFWDDCALTVRFSPDDSLVAIRDAAYNRDHYFADWGIIK